MNRNTVFITLAALLALGSTAARADEPYANDVRLGVYYLYYDTSADNITGPFTPAGLNLKVESVTTAYAAYVRNFSEHFDLELAFGYPPLTKTQGKGPATVGSVPYNSQVIATARWLAPSALLQYKFFDDSHALRPYVGLGVNYTRFYSRQSTAAGNALTGGPTSISLPVAVGPAGNAGVSYRITERFHVYASYSLAEVNTRLTADTAGLIRTTHIEFRPMALVISGGFAF